MIKDNKFFNKGLQNYRNPNFKCYTWPALVFELNRTSRSFLLISLAIDKFKAIYTVQCQGLAPFRLTHLVISRARNCCCISMAAIAPQVKHVACAIMLLAFFVTIATSAEIFLEWHVSTDLNLKPVSTDQPVRII